MQQRKGNLNRKPSLKKGVGAKPVAKKAKTVDNEQPIDLSNIVGYKERKSPSTVSKQGKLVSEKRSSLYDMKYKVGKCICSGILKQTIDRGRMVLPKGQCVLVYETNEPNIVSVSSSDGRSVFTDRGCYERMKFAFSQL